ncbi:MAG TPA: type II toxin-antitoxin system RelE/ParE family toxin [Verrucomicrobiae bacterium]|nr:type II toxin-antitoxin system RelE/ParE family toxin [Verrucomicrobiae bacterium]
MEFFEAPAFTRFVSSYLTDDEYRAIQGRLSIAPEAGDVIPGTGGFRKLRWAHAMRGKGRRGGLRVIYYYFSAANQIWFMTLYDKNEASDLTPKQKQALKGAVEAETQTRQTSRLAKQGRARR